MIIDELWAKINKDNADLLCDLWERWQDEKEYEDIQDYLTVIQKHIPEAYKITKRPFGVHCKCDDGEIHVQVKRDGRYLKLIGKIKKNNKQFFKGSEKLPILFLFETCKYTVKVICKQPKMLYNNYRKKGEMKS